VAAMSRRPSPSDVTTTKSKTYLSRSYDDFTLGWRR